MTPKIATALFVILFLFAGSGVPVAGADLHGNVSLQARLFAESPALPDQHDQDASIALSAEYFNQLTAETSLSIAPFFRIDSSDSKRSHSDLRECSLLYRAQEFEATIGISKVFWGATEFVHLVDIINQTDAIESLDGEEKLGQPMLRISTIRDWGGIDLFLLPLFRERTFPGSGGRLRPLVPIDTDKAAYESSLKRYHPDLATRYSLSWSGYDLGISEFVGTSREPSLLQEQTTDNTTRLYPYYPQIAQTSLDLQMVHDSWLWKAEALYRSGQGRDFFATTFGFEYTFYGIFNTSMDVGILMEYIFDDREDLTPTPFKNDIMAGLRFTANDAQGTEFLAGISQSTRDSTSYLTLSASRRLGASMKVQLDASLFAAANTESPLYSSDRDDFIQLQLITYFP